MSILSKALAATKTPEREPYRPKFCRTRGCNLEHDHEGRCDTAVGVETCHAKGCKKELGHDDGEHIVAVRRSNRFGRYAVTAKRKAKVLPAAQMVSHQPNKAARQRALRALRDGVTPEHVERAA